MSSLHTETEAKFYIRDLSQVTSQMHRMNARLLQTRTHEVNLRFDTPDLDLRKAGRVLRLRQDDKVRMTYKGASKKKDGILSRTEIEFVVEDFGKAKEFLEALGYEKLVFYEKYRTTYEIDRTKIMLDELPYGEFIEIEGESIRDIRVTAQMLGLKWEPVVTSYHALFERVRKSLGLEIADLTFENFKGIHVSAEDLGVVPAG